MWRILPVAITIWLAALNASAQTPDRTLAIDSKQRAALGVTLTTVQAAQAEPLQASASVTVPTGREIAVTAPYPGQMIRILAGIGDSVKVGSSLGQFTSPVAGDARRLRQEAGIDSRLAKATLDREQALFDEGLIPQARVLAARARLETSQASVRAREAELLASGMQFDGAADAKSGYATGLLLAPMAGVVMEVFTPIGQRVEAGTVLFRVVDASQLQLDIQLAPEKAALLKVGDPVSIPRRQASAKITGISQAVDSSQLARVRALIQTRGTLQLGELLSVQIQPGLRRSELGSATGWQVPSRCLSQWQGKPILFVATTTGFLVQPVDIVASNDDMSVVTGPLTAGSQVAVSGIASLRALLQSER